jgi:hypothetical protein
LLEFAAIVPEVAASSSQPTPSFVVQVIDELPVLVSVTDMLVVVLSKSILRGETKNVGSTVIETGILSDPAVPTEKVTYVE